MARAADVRFFFDEDILGLAKVLAPLRPDLTYPGDPGGQVHRQLRPPCPIARGAKDPAWIPLVAGRRWLIVTRDAAMQSHPAHLAAIRSSGARMVVLAGAEATGTWQQLEITMSRWRDLEALVNEPGPFVRSLTRTGPLRPIRLDQR